MVQAGYKHTDAAKRDMRKKKAAARAAARGPRQWSEKELENKRRRQLKRWQSMEYRRNARVRQACTRYGITPEEYHQLWINAEGRCDICWDVVFGDHTTHIDHCHKRNKVRGILCGSCNRGMGFVDNIRWLKRALAYRSRARLRRAA